MLKYVSRQNYTIPGKSTITINFVDPMNYYRVVNSGNVTIYGGTVTMPTRKLYDFKVPAYNAKMYAEENVRKQLYLYNDGTEEATVLLYAFRSQFEPTVLALCDAIFNDTENTVSVEINGFSEPLPTGNNKIGKVDVSSMPSTYDSAIQNINSKFNYLVSSDRFGMVNIDKVYELMVNKSFNPALYSVNATATSAGTVYQAGSPDGEEWVIDEICSIFNDGAGDLTISYTGMNNGTFILKSGEVLNNIKGYFIDITISGNNVPFRFLYKAMRSM